MFNLKIRIVFQMAESDSENSSSVLLPAGHFVVDESESGVGSWSSPLEQVNLAGNQAESDHSADSGDNVHLVGISTDSTDQVDMVTIPSETVNQVDSLSGSTKHTDSPNPPDSSNGTTGIPEQDDDNIVAPTPPPDGPRKNQAMRVSDIWKRVFENRQRREQAFDTSSSEKDNDNIFTPTLHSVGPRKVQAKRVTDIWKRVFENRKRREQPFDTSSSSDQAEEIQPRRPRHKKPRPSGSSARRSASPTGGTSEPIIVEDASRTRPKSTPPSQTTPRIILDQVNRPRSSPPDERRQQISVDKREQGPRHRKRMTCHICGSEIFHLLRHLRQVHGLDIKKPEKGEVKQSKGGYYYKYCPMEGCGIPVCRLKQHLLQTHGMTQENVRGLVVEAERVSPSVPLQRRRADMRTTQSESHGRSSLEAERVSPSAPRQQQSAEGRVVSTTAKQIHRRTSPSVKPVNPHSTAR